MGRSGAWFKQICAACKASIQDRIGSVGGKSKYWSITLFRYPD
ncbi:hypothetical protein LEP1GSC170_1350 [Leptospira interrogans serovar Bataviae str. HAI135]|nr:hypothetical protein LEP1GSC170_1350 [Leptospira interrogans serovar Bataviae str. HAI135]